MKNYFDFQLKGRQLFLLWMVFYLLYVVPYCLLLFKLHSINSSGVAHKPSLIFLLFIPLILVALIWSMYFIKMILQSISLQDIKIKCDFKPGKYLGVVFGGLILSIITLGIYLPWFIRNLHRFYINNSSYKEKNFLFLGKGGKLFLIITLSVVVPMILIVMLLVIAAKRYGIYGIDLKHYPHSFTYVFVHQIITFIILIPCYYLVYKWRVDVKYEDYHIKWHTKFWPSIGKVFLEVVLSVITFGIYLPLAFLRLYKYFAEKTKSNQADNQSIQFGYDIDQLNDFLMIWGQLLLTAVTLGISYPWAVSKIGKRVLGKTYIEKINS